MHTLREWIMRLWGTLGLSRKDREHEEELRLHLELATEDARGQADSPNRAIREAKIRAGGMAQAMEAVRDQRGLPWLEDLARDVRYALRNLRRSPTFTAVALLTIAIGIGANTAVFSVVNGVLLKPLAYPRAEELVSVTHTAPGAPGRPRQGNGIRNLPSSPSMFLTYADHNRTFAQIGLWVAFASTVTGLAEPEQARAILVTHGTLEAIGIQPALGRWLSQADDTPGGPDIVMLSYGYWQRRFGGDKSVIGRRITVDARVREIVGVMPQGFRVVSADPEVILPLRFDRSRLTLTNFGFQVIARLKPGVTIANANADVGRMLPIWLSSWPPDPGLNPRALESWRIAPAVRPLKQDVVGNVGDVLWVLMGTIAIVMLIACANVANLLLVKAEGRQRELAVRAALGAGSWRIVRQLMIESLSLGLIGGALGLGLAYAGLRFLVDLGPANLPRLHEISLDVRALSFTLAISVLSGLLFGLMPALKYGGPSLSSVLRCGGRTSSESRTRHRSRHVLVVVQVALALVLLVSSGLMIRTFQALRGVEPGFRRAEQLQIMRIAIPASLVSDPVRVARMHHDLLDKLATIPSVTSVAFSSAMPMEGIPSSISSLRTESDTDAAAGARPLRWFKFVSPGFFGTAGTRLIVGREYTWTDVYDLKPVAIVSENLARELWGAPAAAIGKRIGSVPDTQWREVIGVVQDIRENGVHEPAPAIVYWPSLIDGLYRAPLNVTRTATYAIRSDQAGTETLLSQVRRAVWSVNANLPVASVRTMQEVYDQSMARTSFMLVMLAIAGAMALVLGIIGIYGVISYAVSQRTREIGIRLALGAQQGALKRMFVGHGLVLAGVGVAIGLGAAVALTRLMSSLLFGISPLDPTTYVAVPCLLVIATVLASYLPARRAAAVNPLEALKAE